MIFRAWSPFNRGKAADSEKAVFLAHAY